MSQHPSDERSASELVVDLVHAPPDVRWRAMNIVISRCIAGDGDLLEPLIGALGHADTFVRLVAAEALGHLGNRRAIEHLLPCLVDADPVVRRRAVGALGILGDDRTLAPLIASLRDQDPAVRRRAAISLGQIRDPGACHALILALQDEDRLVRLRVVEALTALGDSRSIGVLVQIAGQRDEYWRVRRAATRALSRFGPRAWSLLRELAEQDSYVQGWAQKTLRQRDLL